MGKEEKFIKLNIKPGERIDYDALTYSGNDKEIDPASVNYESKCPTCGTLNYKEDITRERDKLSFAYKCRKCGEKYFKTFGITIG